MQRRSTGVLALAVASGLAGCGGATPTAKLTPAAQPAPTYSPAQPKPAVRFLAPRSGERVGDSFTARVALTNFTIDPGAVGQVPRPGRGHLHFQLDGGRFDYPRFSGPNGVVGKGLGVSGQYSPALAPFITYSHIPAGRHQLVVYLANNNHTNVGAIAKLTIDVR